MTNIDEIKTLNEQYFNWLRDKTVLREVCDNWTEITTPFLDRHNDCLQIYVKPEKNNVSLSDDGYIVSDLRMYGCDIDSPKRKSILQEMLNGFGIKLVEGRLEAHGNRKEFPQLKHNLVQAMLSVDDMFYLSSPHVASLFSDDAASWLDASEIRFTPKIKFVGKSGFSYNFFAAIPKSSKSPERIVQPINNPDKNSVQRLIFEWDDIKETRWPGSVIYPILNDSKSSINPTILSALEKYGINGILWSEREKHKNLLAS